MGRDHSIKCVVCGFMRGGLDDLECACEQPYVALVHGLATLAHNLAVAGAMMVAALYAELRLTHGIEWMPGCGVEAPGWNRRST